jgi:hypothetical protein
LDEGACSRSTGIVGNFAVAYTPGTAYVLLHHLFGKRREFQGLGSCDRRHGRDHPGHGQRLPGSGVDIVLSSPVSEIIVEKGRAAASYRAARVGARQSLPQA